jgi:putative glutamine amidotransferase
LSIRIGITTSATGPGAIDAANVVPYANAVRFAGAEPLVLPNYPARVDELLESVDGIVLGGGDDLDPARYGEAALAQTSLVAPERDAFEFALIAQARSRLVPALCICRGLQVANVAFGGTLIQDLPAHFREEYVIHHRQTTEDGMDRTDYGIDHYVMVEPESALARLAGDDEFATNTMHHQAALAIGRGLRAVAWTHDGVIEGLDAEFEHPFFYCVQWHPEELMDDPVSQNLFRGLVAAASLAKV